MSHKNAPVLTDEQLRFETALRELQEPGVSVGLGRDAGGNYQSLYARTCWKLWQRAISEHELAKHPSASAYKSRLIGSLT